MKKIHFYFSVFLFFGFQKQTMIHNSETRYSNSSFYPYNSKVLFLVLFSTSKFYLSVSRSFFFLTNLHQSHTCAIKFNRFYFFTSLLQINLSPAPIIVRVYYFSISIVYFSSCSFSLCKTKKFELKFTQ